MVSGNGGAAFVILDFVVNVLINRSCALTDLSVSMAEVIGAQSG